MTVTKNEAQTDRRRSNGAWAWSTEGARRTRPPASSRKTIRKLLEDNSENVALWLEQVAQDDGQGAGSLAKLVEYAAPKLGRIEHVGDGGGPVQIVASKEDERL